MKTRDLDEEFSPNEERDYLYKFDVQSRKILLNRFLPHLDRQGRSLEMGSFDGSMTNLLLEEVDSLEVLEGSAELASQLVQRLGDAVIVHQGWFEDFAPQRKYDQIFLIHGLEHVDDPILVLKRSSSWLNAGGKLFVAVPNASALSRQIAVKMGVVESLEAVTPGEEKHGHRRTYNLDTLLRDFKKAGLTVTESGGVILKPLSNAQFDAAMESGIVSSEYLAACEQLSRVWPEFSASIYAIVEI